MGTRTYSRRAADGTRRPTALGIRTGRYQETPATATSNDEPLFEYQGYGPGEIRGTLNGQEFRVVDMYTNAPKVGHQLRVNVGDKNYVYVREESDIGVPTIELAEKIRELARKPRRPSVPPEFASYIKAKHRELVRLTNGSLEMFDKDQSSNDSSDKTYISQLDRASMAPFYPPPFIEFLDEATYEDTKEKLLKLRNQYKDEVFRVEESKDSRQLKAAKIKYLTTQLVNMYERAASIEVPFRWHNVLNETPNIPMRFGLIRNPLSPEEYRKAIVMSARSIIDSLYQPGPDRTIKQIGKATQRTIQQHVEDLVKKRYG